LIENPISTLIIEGKVRAGDQIVVDFDGEGFVFNVEKVVFVDEGNPQISSIKKQFLCEKCNYQFETEVVKNATIICPKCLSKQLKELSSKTEEENDQKIKKASNEKKPNGESIQQLEGEEKTIPMASADA